MDRKDVSTIILAAGSGDRLGGSAKAFIEVDGETYLSRAIRLFSKVSNQIIVTLHADELKSLDKTDHYSACKFMEGGQTRQASFEIAFEQVTNSVVIVQDVARPLTSLELVQKILEAVIVHEAVAPVVAVKIRNSLSYVEDGYIGAPVAREHLVSLQTPQAYRTDMLAGVLQSARRESWEEVSVVPLVRRAKVSVKTVEGDVDNIKVIYPEDVEFVAKKILFGKTDSANDDG